MRLAYSTSNIYMYGGFDQKVNDAITFEQSDFNLRGIVQIPVVPLLDSRDQHSSSWSGNRHTDRLL